MLAVNAFCSAHKRRSANPDFHEEEENDYETERCYAARCLIPRFDGVILSLEWKEALWDKFVMDR